MIEPSDIPPHRYTAALAGEIETAWQDRWEREGTFHAPNPSGRWPSRLDPVAGRPPVRARHVPVPERRRAARRAPAGLHRHRRLRALPADDRPQRAAHDGLRRVRPARRAVRRPDRPAPAADHRGEHRDATAGSCAGSASVTTSAAASPPPMSSSSAGRSGSSCRSSTPGTTRPRPGPGRSPSWSPSWTPGPAAGRGHQPVRPAVARADRGRAPAGRRRAPAGVPPRGARELVPGPGNGAGQRGGHPDGRSERGNFPVYRTARCAVDAADHRVRRPVVDDLDTRRLAGVGQGDAAQLDRPLHRRAGPVRLARLGAVRTLGRGHRVDQRVLGRQHHVRRAEQRVRPGGEHLDGARRASELDRAPVERPIQLRCIVLIDSGQSSRVQVVQQPVGVRGDPQHPLPQRPPEDREVAALAAPVDVTSSLASTVPSPGHQFTGASDEVRQPVLVDDPPALGLVQLRPRPAGRVGARGRLPDPGVQLGDQLGDRPGRWPRPRRTRSRRSAGRSTASSGSTRRRWWRRCGASRGPGPSRRSCRRMVSMFASVVMPRVLAGLDRVLLGGQAERVEAHRVQHVEAGHPLVTARTRRCRCSPAGARRAARAARVREHVQHVQLGAGRRRGRSRRPAARSGWARGRCPRPPSGPASAVSISLASAAV